MDFYLKLSGIFFFFGTKWSLFSIFFYILFLFFFKEHFLDNAVGGEIFTILKSDKIVLYV